MPNPCRPSKPPARVPTNGDRRAAVAPWFPARSRPAVPPYVPSIASAVQWTFNLGGFVLSYSSLLALPLLAMFLSAQEIPKQDLDDHAAARDEWFYSQRQYPLNQIPAGARLKAIEAIKNIERATSARNGTPAAG